MNGLYIGAKGMINAMQHINVHSNNITNSSTNGFKFDRMTSSTFRTHQIHSNINNTRRNIGSMDNKVLPTATHVNLSQGGILITNNNLDFFLNDRVDGNTSFFVVERNGEQFLTRRGNFLVNDQGFLVTDTGDFVLDANNQRIQTGSNDITVNVQGTIFDANGNPIAQLQTRVVNDDFINSLVRHRDGRFTLEGVNINELPLGTADVANGMLELSNVDMSNEMVNLLLNQKLTSSSQRIMTTFNQIYEKEANNLR